MRILVAIATAFAVSASSFYASEEGGTIYFQDFNDFSDGTTELGDGSVMAGEAVIVDGKLQLSRNEAGIQSSFWIPPDETSTNGWIAEFDYEIIETGGPQPADGFSFNYGAIPAGETSPFAEEGFSPDFSPSISFEVDTWLVGTDEVGPAIAVDGVDIPGGFINGDILNVGDAINGSIVISMDDQSRVSFRSTGAITNADFDDLNSRFDLSEAYSFVLAARTGGAHQEVLIDNLRISTLQDPAQVIEEISRVYFDDDRLVLEIPNAPRRTIGIEYSPDLSEGPWIELGNFFPVDDCFSRFIDPDTVRIQEQGYYRAFLRPLLRE